MEGYNLQKHLFKKIACVISVFVLFLYCKSNFAFAIFYNSYVNDSLAIEIHETETKPTVNVNKFSIDRFSITLEKAKNNKIDAEKLAQNNIADNAAESSNQIQADNKDKSELKENISENKKVEDNKPKESDKKTNNKDNSSTSPNYIGRFRIPDVDISVACYAGSEQSVVDKKDSAAFFSGWNHQIIADHNNQGFDKIKSCTVGMLATLETNGESRTYQCVAKMLGHNTGKKLTDDNYNPINNIYPQSLVCYTCNESWTNITMVFFELVQDEKNKESNQNEFSEINPEPKPETKPQPENNPSYGGCGNGSHIWRDWEIAWEAVSDEGETYGWEKRICKVCDEEEWKPIKYE